MDVSIGNPYPASRISPNEVSEQQIPQRFTPQAGSVKRLAERWSRQAVRWVTNRRVWSPRVAAALSFQSRYAGDLESVRHDTLARTGMDVAIGAATSRVVARTASRLAGTAGVFVVAAGQERAFLAPLPMRRLDGVSDAELRVLQASGMVTIGELQRVPKAALQAEFGQTDGLRLWRAARGLDPEPATARRLGDGNARNADAEARLLSGSLRTPCSAGLFAGRGGASTGWLRRVRQFAGAMR
jgi:hypothetical protein